MKTETDQDSFKKRKSKRVGKEIKDPLRALLVVLRNYVASQSLEYIIPETLAIKQTLDLGQVRVGLGILVHEGLLIPGKLLPEDPTPLKQKYERTCHRSINQMIWVGGKGLIPWRGKWAFNDSLSSESVRKTSTGRNNWSKPTLKEIEKFEKRRKVRYSNWNGSVYFVRSDSHEMKALRVKLDLPDMSGFWHCSDGKYVSDKQTPCYHCGEDFYSLWLSRKNVTKKKCRRCNHIVETVSPKHTKTKCNLNIVDQISRE